MNVSRMTINMYCQPTHLGHHPSPRHNISLTLPPHLLLHRHNRIQQSIQMLIRRIIQFLKSIEPDIQICGETGWVVICDRCITEGEPAILIIGEAGDFLYIRFVRGRQS